MIVRGSGAQFKAEAWRHWLEIKYDKCHGFIANTSTVRDPKKNLSWWDTFEYIAVRLHIILSSVFVNVITSTF